MEQIAADGFIYPDWPAPEWVRAACTTRGHGTHGDAYASFNLATHVGDDPLRVAHNRRRLCEQLQLPGEPSWLDQVHGSRVLELPDDAAERAADAAWTGAAGQVCVVMTADCLPVLFCDEAGTAVAAAHAGWRGLADGVLEATVAAMPPGPHTVLAWLGPAIGPQRFEVGAEVHERFVAHDAAAAAAFVPAAPGKFRADLYELARQRLRALGLRRIFGGHWCTHGDAAHFYSFRRDARCGRMASLIWLQPQHAHQAKTAVAVRCGLETD